MRLIQTSQTRNLDFSASAVVTYLLKTYETSSSGKFLFRETRRDALILALKNHRPTNYLLTYIATELEKLPPQEECKSTLLEDVASLVTKCLYDQECRQIVETEIIVDRLPENIKDQFNKFFLADLETLYAQEEEKRDGIEDQIRKLEFKFWKYNKKNGVESYLKAVALPLAFLNPNRQLASLRGSGDSKSLGSVLQDVTDRIHGGEFPVENLFSLSDLVGTFPPGLQAEVRGALQDEAQLLLGGAPSFGGPRASREVARSGAPEERSDRRRTGNRAKGGGNVVPDSDLKHMVLYYGPTAEDAVRARSSFSSGKMKFLKISLTIIPRSIQMISWIK